MLTEHWLTGRLHTIPFPGQDGVLGLPEKILSELVSLDFPLFGSMKYHPSLSRKANL